MQYKFFALISRMRYIARWGLMRNTFQENIQEHSHMVAVLAHALALIERDILGGSADPDRCATAALFHDASEILTGDLPTPIKYYNPEIKKAYKQVEAVSCEKLLALLPAELRPSYAPLLLESDEAVAVIVKAYGTLCGVVGIALNLLLFAGKLFAGQLSGSIAVTADAFNNLSDAGSSAVTLLGFRLAGREPDTDHPFGHGRIEYISGLAVAGLILLMGVELAKSSFDKILHPEEVAFSALALGILAASVCLLMRFAATK